MPQKNDETNRQVSKQAVPVVDKKQNAFVSFLVAALPITGESFSSACEAMRWHCKI